MKLPEEAIQEFIQIYHKTFGEKLSLQEASNMAGEYFELYQLITSTEEND